MILISFALIVFSFLKVSNQVTPNENINEGASTSTSYTESLTECDRCELYNYASKMVHLMLSENQIEGNLTFIINSNLDELTALHDEIFNYFVQAEFGAQDFSEVTLDRRVQESRERSNFVYNSSSL